ncbi:MAG: hypothetical protein Q6K80_01345 [Thermostichus sp. DG_1_6_bins_120]
MVSLGRWLAVGVVAAASLLGGHGVWAQSRNFWLRTGQSAVTRGDFLHGENIWAICDVNCYDVDLILYDVGGRVVAADELGDDYPVVQAPYAGSFSVEVIMFHCSNWDGCAVLVDSDYSF